MSRTANSPIVLPGRPSSHPGGWVRVEGNISTELDETLEDLAKESGASVGDVLVKAIALLKVANDAKHQGKRLAIVDQDLEFETEITGF